MAQAAPRYLNAMRAAATSMRAAFLRCPTCPAARSTLSPVVVCCPFSSRSPVPLPLTRADLSVRLWGADLVHVMRVMEQGISCQTSRASSWEARSSKLPTVRRPRPSAACPSAHTHDARAHAQTQWGAKTGGLA